MTTLNHKCERCGSAAWRMWNGQWRCKRGFMLAAYNIRLSCEDRDDVEALASLADLEQSRS
jgi:ribosomal protein S27AE